ncbi:MAG: hypothetical protein JSW47_15925 [Phycisphaerales bacterium]|nr:MAG: hypothetical protein JSW47_15925 [Phycisphaerales bacterium]
MRNYITHKFHIAVFYRINYADVKGKTGENVVCWILHINAGFSAML